jgi:hypothetical protein
MGYKVGRFLIRRLMKEHGIECKQCSGQVK